jgi:hypothetical protein
MAESYVESPNGKVKAIEATEKDKLSVWEIMIRFKCGKMQVYGQMKRKAKVTSNEEINEVV